MWKKQTWPTLKSYHCINMKYLIKSGHILASPVRYLKFPTPEYSVITLSAKRDVRFNVCFHASESQRQDFVVWRCVLYIALRNSGQPIMSCISCMSCYVIESNGNSNTYSLLLR